MFEGMEQLEQLELSEAAGRPMCAGLCAGAAGNRAHDIRPVHKRCRQPGAARARLVRDAVAASNRVIKPAFGLKIA